MKTFTMSTTLRTLVCSWVWRGCPDQHLSSGAIRITEVLILDLRKRFLSREGSFGVLFLSNVVVARTSPGPLREHVEPVPPHKMAPALEQEPVTVPGAACSAAVDIEDVELELSGEV